MPPGLPRYGDLLAHWQLKAVLRGEAPPLSADALGAAVDGVGATTQALSKLEREAESYWVAEYFRQAAARWMDGCGRLEQRLGMLGMLGILPALAAPSSPPTPLVPAGTNRRLPGASCSCAG